MYTYMNKLCGAYKIYLIIISYYTQHNILHVYIYIRREIKVSIYRIYLKITFILINQPLQNTYNLYMYIIQINQ